MFKVTKTLDEPEKRKRHSANLRFLSDLTTIFIGSDLFPVFVDKNEPIPIVLDSNVRLPELESPFLARLELLCTENEHVDEWLPVFLSLLDVIRETVPVRILKKFSYQTNSFDILF